MTRFLTVIGVTTLVVLLLAGCGDKARDRKVEVSPGQVIVVEEPIKPTHGIVAGLVGNDALYPLGGVVVRIIGMDLNGTTDDSGRFAIVNVPAGIYILEGSKKDHKSVQTTVDVVPDKVAKAVLLLERVPPTDPYHITWSHDAYLGLAAGTVTSGSNVTLAFEIDPSRPVTLVMESTWEGGVFVPLGDRFLNVRLTSLDGNELLRDTATNPVVLHVEAGILPPGQANFRFTVVPEETQTIVYEGRGQTFVTVFYNAAAPSGWSILGGST